jgi:lipoprotein signal peptidase
MYPVIPLLLFLDLFIKHTLPLKKTYPIFTTSFISIAIKKTYNTKLGFSLGHTIPYWKLGAIQFVCLFSLLPYYYTHYYISTIILAGFTNIIDRFYNKAITDYILINIHINSIHIKSININLADIIINYSFLNLLSFNIL